MLDKLSTYKYHLLSLMLIGMLALAACQQAGAPAAGTTEDTSTDTGAAAQDTTTDAADTGAEQREIVWMVRTNTTENPWEQDVVIPAFETANPDTTVNLLIIDQPDIAVKREAMIAAGEPLHVWSTNWGGDGFASDRARGLITDLTPLIERDNVDMSVFIPEVLAIYENEGKQWGIPFLTTGSYVFYNMSLFDEAGLDYPPTDWEDKSWTWDAYVELGKQLTQNIDDPTNATYGIVQGRQNIEGPAMLFGQFPWPDDAYSVGFAPEGITLNTPEVINAYQKHHDLIYVDQVSPDSAAADALAALGGTFQSGRVAMIQDGGWGWWVYSSLTPDVEGGFCWGVAPTPWGSDDADVRAVIYTDPWVITRGLEGQDLEDAWTFVKFLIAEENARTYMQTTNTPPTQSKLQEEWFQQFECMEPEAVKEVYQGAFPHGLESSNHLLVRWDQLNQIWGNQLVPYFNDPAGDAAAVMQSLQDELNAALQQIAEEEGYQQ
jgi:multiple sugar transport system substrate-binding protein